MSSIALNIIAVAGNYERAVESSNSAAAITAVLYPNDHTSCMLHPMFCVVRALIGDSREGAAPEATVFLDRCESCGHDASLQESRQAHLGICGMYAVYPCSA
jgi:hypothetical protein